MNSISSYLLGILQKNIGTSDATSKVKEGKVAGQKTGLEPGQVVTGRLLKARGGVFEIETDRGLLTAKGELDAPRGAMVKLRVLQGGTPARVRLESWSLENSGPGGRLRGLTALSRANISRLKALGSLLAGVENTPVSSQGEGGQVLKNDALSRLMTFFEMGGDKGQWQGAKDVEQAVKVSVEAGIRLLRAVLSGDEKGQEAFSQDLQGDSKKSQDSILKTDTPGKEGTLSLKGDAPIKGEGQRADTQAVSSSAESVHGKKPLQRTFSLNTTNAPLSDGKKEEGPLQVKSIENRGQAPGVKTEPLSKNSSFSQEKPETSSESRPFPNLIDNNGVGGGKRGITGNTYLGVKGEDISSENAGGKASLLREGDVRSHGELFSQEGSIIPAGRSESGKGAPKGQVNAMFPGKVSRQAQRHILKNVEGQGPNDILAQKGQDEAFSKASLESSQATAPGKAGLDSGETPLKDNQSLRETPRQGLHRVDPRVDQPNERSGDGTHKTAMAPNKDAAVHQFARAFLDQLDISQHLQMQLAQKGMELFIMPFFLSHFQGAGQWMFWKETEPEKTDKGAEVSHLFFDLSLKNLGELDIHLLKRDESLSVYIRAEEDKVQVVRKGLFELSQALKGAGFKIADMEVAPRLEGADTISDMFLEDGPSGLHIVT